MDFDAILKRVAPLTKPDDKPVVDEAKVESYARLMAKNGYRLSKESLKAIQLCLEGYGVLISGDNGTGKTLFFETLYKPTPKRLFTASEITAMRIDDLHEWLKGYDSYTFIIDDLGAEPKSNDYGVKFEALNMAIEHRARLRNVQTHITTNLSAKDIRERYGDRVLDRINGMCKKVKFEGASLRNAKAVRLS